MLSVCVVSLTSSDIEVRAEGIVQDSCHIASMIFLICEYSLQLKLSDLFLNMMNISRSLHIKCSWSEWIFGRDHSWSARRWLSHLCWGSWLLIPMWWIGGGWILCWSWGWVSSIPHLCCWWNRRPHQIQFPLSQWNNFSTAILCVWLVVQCGLLTRWEPLLSKWWSCCRKRCLWTKWKLQC